MRQRACSFLAFTLYFIKNAAASIRAKQSTKRDAKRNTMSENSLSGQISIIRSVKGFNNHRSLVKNKWWKAALELKAGDILETSDGNEGNLIKNNTLEIR